MEGVPVWLEGETVRVKFKLVGFLEASVMKVMSGAEELIQLARYLVWLFWSAGVPFWDYEAMFSMLITPIIDLEYNNEVVKRRGWWWLQRSVRPVGVESRRLWRVEVKKVSWLRFEDRLIECRLGILGESTLSSSFLKVFIAKSSV